MRNRRHHRLTRKSFIRGGAVLALMLILGACASMGNGHADHGGGPGGGMGGYFSSQPTSSGYGHDMPSLPKKKG